jgi:8-oxo-dGTP pyrophosphatase MutT (NUDIX family)
VTSAIVPRPASTVVLLRRGQSGATEVLLTHRPSTMDFGPGLHVFPGGAVDPGDGTGGVLGGRSVLDAAGCAAAWADDLAPDAALGHAVAAIRELWEEVGVLLAVHRDGTEVAPTVAAEAVAAGESLEATVERLDLWVATDRLATLSRWVTPPTPDTTRRYDTRFFVADLPAGGEVAIDAREVVAHDWLAPGEALLRSVAGGIDLWPPTSATLRQLLGAQGASDVRSTLSPRSPAPSPVVDSILDGIRRVRLGSGGGVPGRVVDAWLVGRRRIVVVDPGDPTDAGLEAVLGAAADADAEIAGVVATSASPDRAAAAVGLALVAGAPLVASAVAAPAIGDPCGIVGNGEWIRWGDVPIRTRSIEGDPDGAMVLEVPELGVELPDGERAGGA